MKFSAATLFLATITYVSAAAVFIRDEKSDKQRAYDNETHNLKDRGLCRRYAGTEPNYSKINELCESKCSDANCQKMCGQLRPAGVAGGPIAGRAGCAFTQADPKALMLQVPGDLIGSIRMDG
ncbi:hypothetical protein SUNI508_04502 [Seiridium unicorne]|uniref:Uncharacterized protein n=1 Tax=Seiridium unicorne TaxID=138068 RepID=A0ABR2V9D2_9PEZI